MEKIVHSEPKPPRRRIESNPLTYWQTFVNSSYYREGFAKFFEGKKPACDVSPEEMVQVFGQSYDICRAFLSYSKNEDIFKFDKESEAYIDEERLAVQQYLDSVHNMRKGFLDREELEELNLRRTLAHGHLASIFVKNGKAPSRSLGLVMSRLILVGEGLESYQNVEYLIENLHRRGVQ